MNFIDFDKSKYKSIEADNSNLQYMGRIDFTNKKAPLFIYAGSMVKTKFEGTSISIVIKNINSSCLFK